MRTLKQALLDLKSVLETGVTIGSVNTNFAQRVSVWDYGILDIPDPRAIILKPGPIAETIDTYGDEWVRTFTVFCEVYVYYNGDTPQDNIERFLDAIEDFDTILLEKFHLGLTVEDYRAATITGISDTAINTRSESHHEWYGAIISVTIQIPKQASDGAQ